MRYRSLDALRGIAAAVVVVHHCLVTLPVWSDAMLHGVHNSVGTRLLGYPPLSLLWAGDAAVKVFFALSGFVLALMLLRPNAPSYPAFVTKRICRIYLPYIAVVVAAMCLMRVTRTDSTAQLSEWFNASWNQPISFGLIVDHTFMLGQPKYNFVDNPIWSLVHEMRYSLVFPVIVWLVRHVHWRLVVTVSFAITFAAIVGLNTAHGFWAVDSLQYLFLFVAGAELAKHRAEIARWFGDLSPAIQGALACLSLLLLSLHSLNHSPWSAFRAAAYIAPHLGAALLLTVIAGSDRMRASLEKKPLLWIGQVSYSLYLSHLVVLLTLVRLLNPILPIQGVLVAVPFVALAIAGILYQLLEAPAMELGGRLAGKMEPAAPLFEKAAA